MDGGVTLADVARIAQSLSAVPVRADYSEAMDGGLVLLTDTHRSEASLSLAEWMLPDEEFTDRIIKPMVAFLNSAPEDGST